MIVIDLYLEIEGFLEVLFEFKLLEKESAEDAINQIFQNKYDSVFNIKEKPQQEKYMIGVAMDARMPSVIQKYRILKYNYEEETWQYVN